MTPVQRFEALRAQYRGLIPRRKVTREVWRQLSAAAAIEQVREVAAIELAIGRGHDRGFVDGLREEVLTHLAAAGARFNKGSK